MEDNYTNMLLAKRKRDAEKDKSYKEESRKRLAKIAATKIRTTMIGALDAIEKKLSNLWTPTDGDKPTNEQLFLKRLYEEIRQEILDKGNTQIRNLESEFEHYEIEWKRYTLQLPVKKRED